MNIKKFIAIITVITIIAIPSLALASTELTNAVRDSEIQPQWTYILSCSNGLHVWDEASRTLVISISTDVYSGGAGVKGTLEWYNAEEGRWERAEQGYSWNEYTTTRTFHDLEEEFQVSKGGKYRVAVTHYAVNYRGAILESTSGYTNVVQLP